MIALVFLLILLVLSSGQALFFLLIYNRLKRTGVKSFGKVIEYETSRQIMSKNAQLPRIELHGDKNERIVGKPISSWFVELNSVKLNEEMVLFRDKANAEKFVIKGKAEPVANVLVVIITIGYLIWFTTQML